MELVTVDIGGTHARFAIASGKADGTLELTEPITLHTENYASFQTAWEDYRARQGGSIPDRVALAIAGPINDTLIKFTNNPWIIRPPKVKDKLGVNSFTIVNDFEAVAHAVARLGDEHLVYLSGPDQLFAEKGNITVVGPGTGLGVAQLWRDGAGGYEVRATEGGHVDFAPVDAIDDQVLARLRKRHLRVSLERVVAGPGIVAIYETLAAMEKHTVPEREDVEIWQAGMSGEDSLAAAAVDRFCMNLGSAAGDMALAHGGFAGVVVAGGLGYRLREMLPNSGFAERFCNKGRYQQLMAGIPVKLVTHPQPGLYGAAAAYLREHGEAG